MKIDAYGAPVMVSWQLTKDCNLACLHCCTDSAPGRALPGELTREEALGLAGQIIAAKVPYVMLCGGEPTIVPYFWELADVLSRGGTLIKIETNGQKPFPAERLSPEAVRSVQISIDGATQDTYGKMRPGGELSLALAACEAVHKAGLPLEITFAPTRLNIHEAEAVIALALGLGAFRFNTGKLMRLGTAAKLWERLECSSQQYEEYLTLLELKERELKGRLELCFRPFSVDEDLLERGSQPSGTLLVLPDGKVKVTATLPDLCADLKHQTLLEAWQAYRQAWKDLNNMPVMV